MSVKIAPSPRQQFEDANGVPYAGGLLFTYAAGSSTKQATYTDSTGNTANTNPIVLDSAGRTPYGVWLTAGLNYKFVLALSTDTDPPSSPIFTEDVVSGVNDTATTTSQWIASGVTPTYISGTQFTLVGDKTADFHVGRRLKFTVTAGTVYGLITATAYTTLTTVTVVMDSGALDTGLSAVELSILTATGHAAPKLTSANLTALGIQPLDATLTGIAALTIAANEMLVGSGADTFSKLTLDTDGTLAANSDVKLATQKAVKTYVDTASGVRSQTFTANGSWVCPTGITSAWLTGAGGGGAGGVGGASTNGGGGSGAAVLRQQVTVVPGTSYAVTIGAGGATTAGDGNPGTATSFGALLTLAGGAGGLQANTGGASGGAGGQNGGTANVAGLGAGGGSNIAGGIGGPCSGVAGMYGGGGSGGGGAGGNGFILVEW